MATKFLIFLLLIGSFASAQIMQTNSTPGGYKFKALKADTMLILPSGLDTPKMTNPKYGEPTTGAIFYKTADSSVWFRSAKKWNKIQGGGSSYLVSNGLYFSGDTIKLGGDLIETTEISGDEAHGFHFHKITDFEIGLPSAGAGKVLTSDANGFATWQTTAGRFGNDTATIVMAKVHNNAGVTLVNGDVVYLNNSGTNSDAPSVRKAINKGDSTSANTFGFVTGTIAVNDTGYIILSGKIEKLNTSAFSNGDVIYLDSIAGKYTTSKPSAPYHLVYLGAVVKSNNGNGSIFVKVQNGYELEELHNVQINSPVNNQILVYSDTSKLWKNRTPAIGASNRFTSFFNSASFPTYTQDDSAKIIAYNSSGGGIYNTSRLLDIVASGYHSNPNGGGVIRFITSESVNGVTAERMRIGKDGNVVVAADISAATINGGVLSQSGTGLLIGTNAGANNTTATTGNVFLGYNAGNPSGSITNTYNTAVGYNAGAGFTLWNGAAHNLILGSSMGLPSITGSNQIVLGGNGINYFTKFTGNNYLLNTTGAAVTTATASAALEINGTTAGFLPPRLTATQRNAISTPAAGLMVYDTDSSRYMLYGSSWKGLAYTDAGGGGGGSTTSASGTGISLVNGSSLVKRLKAGFNTIVTDNTDSVTISRDTLTQTLTDGATVTFSATAGVSARVTLAGNRTLSITNMNNGMYITLVVIQDGTGGRTLTLPAGVKVVNGGAGAVTLSSAANARDILTFFEIGDVIYCNVGRNYN